MRSYTRKYQISHVSCSQDLQAARRTSVGYLQRQRETLDDLDELGNIMGDMLQGQTEIEVRVQS